MIPPFVKMRRARYFTNTLNDVGNARFKFEFAATKMSKTDQNYSVANLWINHFNAKDLDSLLSLYADDAGNLFI
jgi:hypothetical protein